MTVGPGARPDAAASTVLASRRHRELTAKAAASPFPRERLMATCFPNAWLQELLVTVELGSRVQSPPGFLLSPSEVAGAELGGADLDMGLNHPSFSFAPKHPFFFKDFSVSGVCRRLSRQTRQPHSRGRTHRAGTACPSRGHDLTANT